MHSYTLVRSPPLLLLPSMIYGFPSAALRRQPGIQYAILTFHPPILTGSVPILVLLISSYSDRYQTRGVPVASVFAIAIVGWGILYGVNPVGASAMDLHARYFGCICIVTAGCTSPFCCLRTST